MRAFFHTLLNAGLSRAAPEEREHVYLLNWIAIAIGLASIFYCIVFAWIEVWSFLWFHVPVTCLYFSAIWLNWRGWFYAARTSFIGTATIFMIIYGFAFEAGIHYWLWLIAPALFLVYPPHQRRTIRALILLSVAGFLVVEYVPLSAAPFAFGKELTTVVHAMSSLLALIFLPLIQYVFFRKLMQAQDARHRSIRERAQILDSVPRGILTMDAEGRILPDYSRRAAELLEVDPSGRQFPELFAGVSDSADLPQRIADFLRELRENPYMSRSMLEKVNPLKEVVYRRPGAEPERKRVLSFRFSGIRGAQQTRQTDGDEESSDRVIAVFEDRTRAAELTAELEERNRAEEERVRRLFRILQMEGRVFADFLREGRAALASARASLESLQSRETAGPASGPSARGEAQNVMRRELENAYREVHTLKGNARAVNLEELARSAHALEDHLETLVMNRTVEQPISQADLQSRLERALNSLGELEAALSDGAALLDRVLELQQGAA